jgi:hypothetical protein
MRRADEPENEGGAEPSADGDSPPAPEYEPAPSAPKARRFAFAMFAAQLLGGGQKRGLRGGAETLDRARTAYLETEWSGPSDRRVRRGRITKTEV